MPSLRRIFSLATLLLLAKPDFSGAAVHLRSLAADDVVEADVVVLYHNPQATPDACTADENWSVEQILALQLDQQLEADQFGAFEWQYSADSSQPDGFVRKTRQLQSNCLLCVRYYSEQFCNEIYNCGFRRRLQAQNRQVLEATTGALSQHLITACQDVLEAAAKELTPECQQATQTSTCVAFIE